MKWVYVPNPPKGDPPADDRINKILDEVARKYKLPWFQGEFHDMQLEHLALYLMDCVDGDGPSFADLKQYNETAKMLGWPLVEPSLPAASKYNNWASLHGKAMVPLPPQPSVLPAPMEVQTVVAEIGMQTDEACSLSAAPSEPSVLPAPKVGVDMQVQTDVATIETVETHAPKTKAPRQKTKWVDPASCSILPFVQRRA